jgi:hypothetical protein
VFDRRSGVPMLLCDERRAGPKTPLRFRQFGSLDRAPRRSVRRSSTVAHRDDVQNTIDHKSAAGRRRPFFFFFFDGRPLGVDYGCIQQRRPSAAVRPMLPWGVSATCLVRGQGVPCLASCR